MEWVDVLRCTDGSLYVGHTSWLGNREAYHTGGRGSRYTAASPVSIVYAESYDSIDPSRLPLVFSMRVDECVERFAGFRTSQEVQPPG